MWSSSDKTIWRFFAKEPCKRDYILQKRPIILSSLLVVATPWSLLTSTRNLEQFRQDNLEIFWFCWYVKSATSWSKWFHSAVFVFFFSRYHVSHETIRCVTRLNDTCDMTQSYTRHDWILCVTWFIYMCGMTQWYVGRDSTIYKRTRFPFQEKQPSVM